MRSRRFTARLAPLAAAVSLLFAQSSDMVEIPGGEFERGRSHSLPDDGLKWVPELVRDDRPVRTVRIDPFELSAHEVTNAEYLAYVEAGKAEAPYYWPQGRPPEGRADFPVVDVTWAEAAGYCAWRGGRLPREVEWERACRGGAEARKYSWGDAEATKERARFDAVDGPVAVGSFEANAYGLYDMSGNVWEWTADWYGREYYREAPAENPSGPDTGEYRVLRGGSWADETKHLTCAHRSYARPDERSPNIGFRCARSSAGQAAGR